MVTSSARYQPRDAGSLLDSAINLYRRNIVLFISISAVALIPAGLLQLLLTLAAPQPATAPTQLSDLLPLLTSGLISLLASVVGVMAGLAVCAAIVSAASAAWLDRRLTVGEAYNLGLSRVWALLGLTVLVGLVVGLLAVTIIGSPFALYLGVGWSVSVPVLLLERTGVGVAMVRSRELIKGGWWRVLGILIILVLIEWMVGAIFTMPATIAAGSTVFSAALHGGTPHMSPLIRVMNAVGGTAAGILAQPILYCGLVVLYYDLRARREGFDLEQQAAEIGPDPADNRA